MQGSTWFRFDTRQYKDLKAIIPSRYQRPSKDFICNIIWTYEPRILFLRKNVLRFRSGLIDFRHPPITIQIFERILIWKRSDIQYSRMIYRSCRIPLFTQTNDASVDVLGDIITLPLATLTFIDYSVKKAKKARDTTLVITNKQLMPPDNPTRTQLIIRSDQIESAYKPLMSTITQNLACSNRHSNNLSVSYSHTPGHDQRIPHPTCRSNKGPTSPSLSVLACPYDQRSLREMYQRFPIPLTTPLFAFHICKDST